MEQSLIQPLTKLSRCPKCNGKLFVDEDIYGRYVLCVSCGYEKNFEKEINKKEDKQ